MDPSAALIAAIDALPPAGRRIVALAGAPGSGKSTLAAAVVDRLNARQPGLAALVPMDGYHLDNAILDARGWRAVKGAPQTFDADGLACDLVRLRAAEGPVMVPVFDRAMDLARAAAREVPATAQVVLVEGNWLLLDSPPWAGLAPLFDLTALLRVPEPVLERRLIDRWLAHGLDAAAARARALGNDLPNARRVAAGSRPADVVLEPPVRGGLPPDLT
jgi:pantothenate kinase